MKIKKVNSKTLNEMLSKGVVTFQYTKKDGSTRTARGTNLNSLITKKPHGGVNGAEGAGYKAYFDLDKNDWRNYHPSNLIGVVED